MDDGRQLDALVAEKVMGTPKYWVVMFGGSRYGTYSSLEISEIEAIKIQGDHKATLIPYYDEPHYSTKIEDAWQVVEKLKDVNNDCSSYDFDLIYTLHEGFGKVGSIGCRTRPESKRWFAQFGDSDIAGAHAPTAPLAICIAALKAVGVEVA